MVIAGNEVELQIQLPFEAISELCQQYNVEELAVFGSILRDDFGSDSDVDFLVTFTNDDEGPWMSYLQSLESELSNLIGREVDVVSRRGLEWSKNVSRRQAMVDSARIIYER